MTFHFWVFRPCLTGIPNNGMPSNYIKDICSVDDILLLGIPSLSILGVIVVNQNT